MLRQYPSRLIHLDFLQGMTHSESAGLVRRKCKSENASRNGFYPINYVEWLHCFALQSRGPSADDTIESHLPDPALGIVLGILAGREENAAAVSFEQRSFFVRLGRCGVLATIIAERLGPTVGALVAMLPVSAGPASSA